MEEEPLKHLRLMAVLAAMIIFATACTGGGESPSADEESEAPASQAAESEAAEMPEELVIGFVPSREADALVDTIQPVADALEEALGIPV